jgi:hypothetical protein
MTDRDKNRDETAPTDEELAGDEELDEESDQTFETADEAPEGETEYEDATGAAPSGTHRRFGLGRGGHDDEEPDKRQIGSVRGTHERVHIDDRASAVFALVCAALLLAVLIVPMVAGALPQPVGPSLAPLVVPTGQAPASTSASPSGSAAASVSIAPSASVAPSASAIPVPSASAS